MHSTLTSNLSQILCDLLNIEHGKNSFTLQASGSPFQLSSALRKIALYIDTSSSEQEFEKQIREQSVNWLNSGFERVVLVSTLPFSELVNQLIDEINHQKASSAQLEYWHWDYITDKIEQHSANLPAKWTAYKFPKHLTALPPVKVHGLYVPQEILAQLHAKFEVKKAWLPQVEKPLLVYNPLHGSGTSSLALAYVHTPMYAKKYDHIAWIHLANDVRLSIVSQLSNPATRWQYDSRISLAENAATMVELLNLVEGNNLLVLDGIDQKEQLDALSEFTRILKWKTLATSTHKRSGFSVFQYANFSAQQSDALFTHFYKQSNSTDFSAQLNEIALQHPLLVSILARKMNTSTWLDPANMLMVLETAQKRTPHLKPYVPDELDADTAYRYRTILKYLLAIVDTEAATFTRAERTVLRQLSVLPQAWYTIEQLTTLLGVERSQQARFSDTLLEIIGKNWLQVHGDSFFIHPMVQKVMRKKLKPDGNNLQSLLVHLSTRLTQSNDNSVALQLQYIPLAESCIDCIQENKGEAYLLLIERLMEVMQAVGNPWAVRKYALLQIKLVTSLLDPDEPEYPAQCTRIARNYLLVKHYARAAEFALMAFEYTRKNHPQAYEVLAQNAVLLCQIYFKSEQLDFAVEYIDKALEWLTQLHPQTAKPVQEALLLQEDVSKAFEQKEQQKRSKYWLRKLSFGTTKE